MLVIMPATIAMMLATMLATMLSAWQDVKRDNNETKLAWVLTVLSPLGILLITRERATLNGMSGENRQVRDRPGGGMLGP